MDRLLVADRVVTGDGTLIDDGAVLVRGAAIAAVGRAADFGGSPAMPVCRYGGASLLPGLIDTHAHLTFPADQSSYDEIASSPEETLLATAARNAMTHARAGVTTIRDNGAPHRSAFAFREQLSRHPGVSRLLVCGAPITPAGGHLHWCGGSADGVDGVRAAVARLAGQGADHVKVMASGGGTRGTSQWLPSYEFDVLHAVVEEAHERGLAVAAHCHATVAIDQAASAGVDVIEHASFVVPPPPGSTPRHVGAAWSGLVAKFSPSIAELIGANGCFVGATVQGGLARRDELLAQQSVRQLSAAEKTELTAAAEHVERKLEMVASLVAAGLREQIVISSDAGPADTSFGRLHTAVQVATDAGLTNPQALEAVTRVAARALGMGERTGVLRRGLAADVLVVDGNPYEDLSCLERVRDVYFDGCRLNSEGFQAEIETKKATG